MKKIAFVYGLVALLVAAAGRSQAPTDDPAYRIGPRDLIAVHVDEDKTLDGDHRVSETGFINMRLLGDVQVAGKTALEAAAQIRRQLIEKYMQKASVDVEVKEFRSRPISVIGAVKQPGALPFSGRWTLLEALTAVGGLSEDHGSVIYVTRRPANGLDDQLTIDLEDLFARGVKEVNIPLFPNDLVNVPGTITITVYCLGEVKQPGALSFKSNERISLLAAIAHAGGLTDRASSRILIKRSSRSGGADQEINVDFKRILAGKEPDVDLKQGDVIVVKESFF